MTSVADLTTALPHALRHVAGPIAPVVPLTGVHISEIDDPTAFLSGGELLLTTGMSLRGGAVRIEGYVARLLDGGVTALALGLGPVHDVVPAALDRACARGGLPLYVVPVEVPFLTLTREFWRRVGQEDTAAVEGVLGAHRSLVRAASGVHRVRGTLRVVAEAVDGWAAFIGAGGQVETVWPPESTQAAAQAAQEVGRLVGAAPSSAATFPLGDLDVVAHTVARRGVVRGHLVGACPRENVARMRTLALSAAALLELGHDEADLERVRQGAADEAMAWLALRGHIDAAASLGRDVDRPVPTAVCLALVETPGTVVRDDLGADVSVLPLAAGRALLVTGRGREVLDAAVDRVRTGAPRARIALTPPVPPGDMGRVVSSLQSRVAALPEGTVDRGGDSTGPDGLGVVSHDPATAAILETLLAYDRADLLGALAAYLRRQGRAETAAADLGIHRNTLRYRLSVITSLTGLDLTDPDVSARWWLLLRARGLA